MEQVQTIAAANTLEVARPTHADLDKIIIEYQNPPMMTETAFDFQPFPWQKALAERKIIIEVMAKTKTRFYIGVRTGNKYESVLICPPGSEHLKFFEQPMRNMRTNERFNHYYFVAGKKQGVKELEDHIRRIILHKLNLYGTQEPFTVIIWSGKDFRLFQSVVS
jgi:hypothetical protein